MAKQAARGRPVANHRGKGDGRRSHCQEPGASVHNRPVATKATRRTPTPPAPPKPQAPHGWGRRR